MAGGSSKKKKEKKIYLVNGRGQLKPPFHLLSTAALAIHPWAERLHVGLQQNHDQHTIMIMIFLFVDDNDDDNDGNDGHHDVERLHVGLQQNRDQHNHLDDVDDDGNNDHEMQQ